MPVKPHVLYLAFNFAKPSGVIDSQMVAPLLALGQRDVDLHVIGIDGLRSLYSAERHTFRRRWHQLARRQIARRHYTLPGFGKPQGLRLAAWVIALGLWPVAPRQAPFIVHCRTDIAGYVGQTVKHLYPNARVLLDVRGDRPNEFLYEAAKRGVAANTPAVHQEYRWLVEQERTAVGSADHLLCVSRAMGQQLQERYTLPPERLTVIPCSADPASFRFDPDRRARMRNELGLHDKFVLVYSGSMHRWQLPEKVVELYQVWQRVRPHTHLLFLTRQIDQARRFLTGRLAPESYTLRSLPHEQIAAHLMAGDVGLLLREPDPLNMVASPVKFAEYLLCGLPVVITPGIGDTEDLVRRQGLGLVLADLHGTGAMQRQVENFLAAHGDGLSAQEERRRISAVGCQHFSLHANVERLLYCYHALAQVGDGEGAQ